MMSRYSFGLYKGLELIVVGHLEQLQAIQKQLTDQWEAIEKYVGPHGFVCLATGEIPDISLRRVKLVSQNEFKQMELEKTGANTAVSEQGAGGLRSDDPTRAT